MFKDGTFEPGTMPTLAGDSMRDEARERVLELMEAAAKEGDDKSAGFTQHARSMPRAEGETTPEEQESDVTGMKVTVVKGKSVGRDAQGSSSKTADKKGKGKDSEPSRAANVADGLIQDLKSMLNIPS